MNILKIGNKKKKKNNLSIKYGGALERKNEQQAATFKALKTEGMATQKQIDWLDKYNKSKQK